MDAIPFEKSPQTEIGSIDFCRFWILYPRRVAKKDAEKAWSAMTAEQKFAAIESLPIHVRYWTAAGTEKEWLPYPASWLRGERWTDELELPVPKNVEAAWWTSETGIMREGLKRGLKPRAGESLQDFKARVAMAPA
jgi:hypothetical protein